MEGVRNDNFAMRKKPEGCHDFPPKKEGPTCHMAAWGRRTSI